MFKSFALGSGATFYVNPTTYERVRAVAEQDQHLGLLSEKLDLERMLMEGGARSLSFARIAGQA